MLYCVTGATGLLGNNLVRGLLKAGHQVRVSIRSTSNREALNGLNVEIVSGDLLDESFVSSFLKGSDGLFHSAGFIWFGNSRREKSHQINVQASEVLARESARQNIRMVHVSSTDTLAAGTVNRPANELDLEPAKGNSSYVASKRAAERKLLALKDNIDLDVVIVCPGLLVGPYDWRPSTGQMILAVTDGYIPLAPSGGISVADVRNVVDAIMVAMMKGVSGQRYILAGENISYLDLWRRMARLAGRKGPLAKMNATVERVVGFGGDLFGKVFSETNVNSAGIQMGSNWNYYDSSKAIHELGYQIGNVDVALQDAWSWLVEHGYSKKHRSMQAT